MHYSIADAKNQLPKLIREVEQGQPVTITRHGKAVVQIVLAPPAKGKVQLGAMRDRIKLLPGWDDPIDEDAFLRGD